MLKNNVELSRKVVLVTGAAGFIGSNLVMELIRTQKAVHVITMMYPSRNIVYSKLKNWQSSIRSLPGNL